MNIDLFDRYPRARTGMFKAAPYPYVAPHLGFVETFDDVTPDVVLGITSGGDLLDDLIASGERGGYDTGVPATGRDIVQDYLDLIASGQAGGYDTGVPDTGIRTLAQQAAITAMNLAGKLATGEVRRATGADVARCPSGYVLANGQCAVITPAPQGSSQWFQGISNEKVLLIAGGVLIGSVVLKSLMGGGGGRRR